MVWSPTLEIPRDFVVKNRMAKMDKVCAVYPVSKGGSAREHAQSGAAQSKAGASRLGVVADKARVQ